MLSIVKSQLVATGARRCLSSQQQVRFLGRAGTRVHNAAVQPPRWLPNLSSLIHLFNV